MISDPPAVEVLHRDDELVAVNKPSGLLVHRSEVAPDRDVLLQRVVRQVGEYLYTVHRIDRAASGVVVFARSAAAAKALQAELALPDTRKEYLVLVRGQPPDHWTVDRPLKDDRGIPREARTDFETVERLDRCALLRARIHTGRRHQIRRHCNHSAHQILGDTTYGKGGLNRLFRERYGLHRLFLHAVRLQLPDRPPLAAPLPAELAAVRDRLRTP